MAIAKSRNRQKQKGIPNSPQHGILEEFKRLYGDTVLEIRKKKYPDPATSPAYKTALTYAHAQKIYGAETLLSALLAVNTSRGHSEALTSLQSVIPHLVDPLLAPAWNIKGILSKRLMRPDDAIKCFLNALAVPGYENWSVAIGNLGSAYADKGEYISAIEYYNKALNSDGPVNKALILINLSNALRLSGRYQEALVEIKRVIDEPTYESEHARARHIQKLIEESLAGLQPTVAEEALVNKDEESKASEDTPEQDMLRKLGDQTRKDKYDKYLLQDLSNREPHEAADVFVCLRGWSSAVTLLEGGEQCQWSGGGYFLRWQGKGIVIDPGFDFVDNFHDVGLNLKEVDAVLVSHNHSDHNYDLNSLDDLRYELHRRWTVLKSENKITETLSKCLFIIDEDTALVFRHDSAKHRGRPLKFDLADAEHANWFAKPIGLPLTIQHFEAKHGRDVPNAVGLRLRLHDKKSRKDFILGYTGDTRWHSDLAKDLTGCDVLLAHISMPDEEELLDELEYKSRIGKPKDAGGFRNLPSDGFKATHLGYRGMLELICATKPKMVLVGEFWAGLEDLRIDLIKGLRLRVKERIDQDIPILPTGLGFSLSLPSMEIQCTSCKKAVSHIDLKIAPAATSFGPLGYLCPKCLV